VTHAASAVEKELVKFSGIRAYKDGDRQEFLETLLNNMDKTMDKAEREKAGEGDKLYDALSQEAQDWYQSCNDALDKNSEADLPDFFEAADGDEDADEDAAEETEEDGDNDSSEDEEGGAKASKSDDEDRSDGKRRSDDRPRRREASAKKDAPAEDAAPKRRGRPPGKKADAKAAKPAKEQKASGERRGRKPAEDKGERKAASNGRGNGKPDSKPKAAAGSKRTGSKLQEVLSLIWKHPTKKASELHEMHTANGGTASLSTVSTVRSDFRRGVMFLDKKGALSKNPFRAAD